MNFFFFFLKTSSRKTDEKVSFELILELKLTRYEHLGHQHYLGYGVLIFQFTEAVDIQHEKASLTCKKNRKFFIHF